MANCLSDVWANVDVGLGQLSVIASYGEIGTEERRRGSKIEGGFSWKFCYHNVW
jgi:hypothetical protein